MVERWKAAGMPQANVHSRFNKRGWGTIVGGILEACGEPDFLANAEEAATSLDETRREFAELIGVLADHPQGTWTASELVDLCNRHRSVDRRPRRRIRHVRWQPRWARLPVVS